MRKLFGTDGIRGKANVEPLTPATLTRLGQAIGLCFMRGKYRHRVVIGKDTRLSGYMVESSLAAGFVSVGMDVAFVGPLPTPAVAMLTRSLRADLGVMISASHNPFADNGIKLFDPDGLKLSDKIEKNIEVQLDARPDLVQPLYLGQMVRIDDAIGRYIEFIKSSLPRHTSFEGMKIVVDCGHGAAYKAAPLVLKELGVTVIPLGMSPNGKNINKSCGTMHPQAMCRKVRETQADLGIAFDGDADRVIFCDEEGQLVEGDQILALLATHWGQQGLLKRKALVGSIMSNLGLEAYLNTLGIALLRAPVGDRYITEKMREEGCNVGGEPSGHIILSDYATGGDGLLTALQVLLILARHQKPASTLMYLYTPFPQVLKNVSLPATSLENAAIQSLLEDTFRNLDPTERLIIRPSGTEPCIRLMAEGRDKGRLQHLVDSLSDSLIALAAQDVA